MKQHKTFKMACLAVIVNMVGMGSSAHAQTIPTTGVSDAGALVHSQKPNVANMTAQQRQELREQMRAETLRSNLTNAGFADKTIQDAIVNYSIAQDQATQSLRDQGKKIIQSFRDKTVTDDQMATLVNDFRATAQDVKADREAALAKLDAKIHYSTNPRLDAYMMMMGLVGDETSILR